MADLLILFEMTGFKSGNNKNPEFWKDYAGEDQGTEQDAITGDQSEAYDGLKNVFEA